MSVLEIRDLRVEIRLRGATVHAVDGASLQVEEGETVEAGKRLAVVEAMKMEHALVAPRAGVVRDLTANVGDQVEMGERIMRVEAAGHGEGEGPAERE